MLSEEKSLISSSPPLFEHSLDHWGRGEAAAGKQDSQV